MSAPLAEFAATNREDPRWEVLRDQLIAGFLPLAQRIARRFARRGEPVDDLAQVATLGLIRALDHYDPEYGPAFLPYAVPTIVGEIRRHFRDQGWGVRVPRRLKDLYVSIGAAVEKLGTQLGRAPRPSELAAHLNLTVEEVLEGLDAAHAYRTESLDKVLHTDEGGTSLSDLLGCPDPDLELVDYHETLQPLLAALPNRERTILMMRFFGNMTQRQIADRVGISQMHVSRVLDATLSRLRHELLDG